MDEKVFVLLGLLKRIRMLGESEILSFFVSGVNQGELGGGVHPRFSCVTQEIKLTLKTSTSTVVQFIACGGFVDD